jgi:RNA polymerase sigma-70 factor (ECF subfamily)
VSLSSPGLFAYFLVPQKVGPRRETCIHRLSRAFRRIRAIMQLKSNSQVPDENLMLRYRNGDEEAFEILFRRYEKPVFSFIYRILMNTVDAEDICQETFLRLIKKIDNYQESGNLKTWIFRIALNLCRDRLRRKKFRTHRSIDEPSPSQNGNVIDFKSTLSDHDSDQSDCLEKDEMREVIQQAFAKLPEKQRTVVILKEYQEMKFSEISNIMNKPIGTVKSLNHRGRQKLKKILANYII